MILSRVDEFAALLRDQRQERGISQAKMAEDIGVSRRWLVLLEQGKIENPGFESILKALHYLELVVSVQQRARLLASREDD